MCGIYARATGRQGGSRGNETCENKPPWIKYGLFWHVSFPRELARPFVCFVAFVASFFSASLRLCVLVIIGVRRITKITPGFSSQIRKRIDVVGRGIEGRLNGRGPALRRLPEIQIIGTFELYALA
jgi:hypothetical protein